MEANCFLNLDGVGSSAVTANRRCSGVQGTSPGADPQRDSSLLLLPRFAAYGSGLVVGFPGHSMLIAGGRCKGREPQKYPMR